MTLNNDKVSTFCNSAINNTPLHNQDVDKTTDDRINETEDGDRKFILINLTLLLCSIRRPRLVERVHPAL